MTENLNQRITITFDSNGNIVQNSQMSQLSNEQKKWASDLVRDVIAAQGNTINTLINYSTKFPTDANVPGADFAKSVFGTVDVTLSYLKYRDEQRALNPQHSQTYMDEMSGAFNAAANSYISGELAAQTGLGLLALGMPLSYAVGGVVVVGWASGKAYDAYLKDDANTIVESIVDYFFGGQEPQGSLSIAIDAKSKSTLNYTLIPGSVLSDAQSQQQAIKLLNDISDGQLNQTPIPQKIIIKSSHEAEELTSVYTVKSGDTISKITSDLKIPLSNLVDLNPWLEEGERISEGGKYILIKPGEKLKVVPDDNDSTYTLPPQYVTDEEGNVIFNQNGDLEYKDINYELNKVLSQNNGQTQEQKAESWLRSVGDNISDWVSDAGNMLGNFLNNLVSTVGTTFDKVSNWFSSILSDGESDKTYNSNQIDNSFLNLDIRTNLTSNFLGNNNITQTGNIIGDGDWEVSAPINNLNGDGYKNVAPYGIVSDQFRPGNSELSQYANFNTELRVDFSRLDNLMNKQSSQQLNFQLQNPLANLTNNFINARTFLNIDPVVLDLNGDGVKLTSYNNSEVTFDVDNDGKAERTGWVSKEDGILVEDQNNNGKIDNITETISEYYKLQGSNWTKDGEGKYSSDGLAALKKLDSNNDGKFSSSDAKWNDLLANQVYQDNGGKPSGGWEKEGSLKQSLVVFAHLIFCFVFFLQNCFASSKNQVSFHNPSQLQVKTIKDYYNGQYPKQIYEDLLTDEVDLNNDKRNELFVYYGNSINCGTSGCNTEIFVFGNNKKIKKIFSESTYGKINILNSESSGFKDLEIIGGTQHIKNVSNLFKWNKTSQNYQYQK
ncbi:hypothetical protein LBMAG18_09800 [Alphaproteobacteria bacterium]|nr:hypothetical protein LBMAG18_09800 [Alphaproteobacteria bacterium]